MPVVVEHITSLSPEDRVDVHKIWNDAPESLTGSLTVEEWLTLTSHPRHRLYAGRFNDRLLVAALVEVKEDKWQLPWICVRSVTRNRGVGLRMINELERIARENTAQLVIIPPDQNAELPGYFHKFL